MRVAVVVPTYNERENILLLLKQLMSITSRIKNHSFTFLVVDDNSPDGTGDEVRLYMRRNSQIFLLTGLKEGLGKALLRGLQYAKETLMAEILVQMDADLSHNPEVLPKFITAIDNGADLVVGSRYIPGGSIPSNWGIHRKIYSVVGNSFVRFGLGYTKIHDWTGGYRAFRAQLFDLVSNELSSFKGYLFQIAFLHKLLKKKTKVVEVPINFLDRRFGRSKIAPSEYIRNILEYVFSERIKILIHGPFKNFLVVGSIGFIINTAILELMVRLHYLPTVGSIVGSELAIIFNFTLNNIWTFNSKRIKGRYAILSKFIQFNGTSIGSLLIQAATIFIGTSVSGISSYRIFYLLGVGIGLAWNYVTYSKVIWR